MCMIKLLLHAFILAFLVKVYRAFNGLEEGTNKSEILSSLRLILQGAFLPLMYHGSCNCLS